LKIVAYPVCLLQNRSWLLYAGIQMPILTDTQWNKVKQLIPRSPTVLGGRPQSDHRKTLDGIIWMLRTGASWRKLPPEYGVPTTVLRRLKKWTAEGTWRKIWLALLPTWDKTQKNAWSVALREGKCIPNL
jgi:transposase